MSRGMKEQDKTYKPRRLLRQVKRDYNFSVKTESIFSYEGNTSSICEYVDRMLLSPENINSCPAVVVDSSVECSMSPKGLEMAQNDSLVQLLAAMIENRSREQRE